MHQIKLPPQSDFSRKEAQGIDLFSAEQCEQLFAAVLVHDDLYLDAKLPDVINLDYSQPQLNQCYLICLQIWQQGVDRKTVRQFIKNIYPQHDLNPEDLLSYKHLRAKFKHLRFAYAAFDEGHQYPTTFNGLISLMGYLQDSLKNKLRTGIDHSASLLRFLLKKVPYALLTRKIDQFKPSSTASFRNYMNDQIQIIQSNVSKKAITGKAFHEVRKVISRLVAIYDCLKVLFPSPEHSSISHYLSTINGMMGSLHDELIAKKINKTQDYYSDTFIIPAEIKQRLISLTQKY